MFPNAATTLSKNIIFVAFSISLPSFS